MPSLLLLDGLSSLVTAAWAVRCLLTLKIPFNNIDVTEGLLVGTLLVEPLTAD